MLNELLRISDLEKRFGGLRAVDGLSLTLAQGEVLAVVGPNGSGKTTLMNLISGAFRPDGGRIHLAGRDVTILSAPDVARAGVSRTFQLVRVMPAMTVLENVVLGAMFAVKLGSLADCVTGAEVALRQVGMQSGWDRMAADITYLDQKRVELARALVAGPKLLLLDEWLAGPNPTELEEGIALIRRIAATGTSVILIEHVMYAVHALASRCIVMNAGRVIADAAPGIALTMPEVITAYLGADDAAA